MEDMFGNTGQTQILYKERAAVLCQGVHHHLPLATRANEADDVLSTRFIKLQ